MPTCLGPRWKEARTIRSGWLGLGLVDHVNCAHFFILFQCWFF